MFRIKVAEKIKTHILCSVTSPPTPENRAVYKKMWKNIVERGRPQMTLHAGYLRLHTHTLTICNTYCCSTPTMCARTRLIVTPQYISCLALISLFTKAKPVIPVLTVTTLTASCIRLTSHIWRRLVI